MLMNLDCIKDVLGYCIKNIDFEMDNEGHWHPITVSLEQMYNTDELKYSEKDIMYSVIKLIEYDYLHIYSRFPEKTPYLDRCSIDDVKVAGHEFYENIRDKNRWEHIKSIAKETGTQSLKVIGETALQMCLETAKNLISQRFFSIKS